MSNIWLGRCMPVAPQLGYQVTISPVNCFDLGVGVAVTVGVIVGGRGLLVLVGEGTGVSVVTGVQVAMTSDMLGMMSDCPHCTPLGSIIPFKCKTALLGTP